MFKRKYYLKILICLIIIGIIPLFILSYMTFYTAKESIESQLIKTNKHYLEKTSSAFDIIFRQTTDSCRQVTVDYSIGQFETFTKGSQFEDLMVEEKKSEILKEFARYINLKARVVERLNVLKLSNEYIDSVYFFDSGKNIVLTDTGVQYSKEEFFDGQLLEMSHELFLSPKIMTTRTIFKDELNEKVISLLYKSENYDHNLFVVNLDAEKLYMKILRGKEQQQNLYLVDKQGKIILGNQDINFKEILKAMDIDSKKPLYQGIYNDTSVVYSIETNANGWILLNVLESSKYYAQIKSVKMINTIIVMLLFFSCLLIAFISSRKIYKPINKLVKAVGEDKNEKDHSQIKMDEFDYISNNFLKIKSEKRKLLDKMNGMMPVYKQRMILDGLSGQLKDIEIELLDIFQELGIHIVEEDFIAISIIVEDYPNHKEDFETKQFIKIYIMHFIEKLFKDYPSETIEDGQNELLTIINWPRKEFNVLIVHLEKLKNHLKEELDIVCSLGISNFYNRFTNLPTVYQESKEALNYRLISGGNEIIYIGDYKTMSDFTYDYPTEKEATLLNCIKAGQEEKGNKVFREIINDIIVKQHIQNYHLVEQLLFQLLNKIFGIAFEFNLDQEFFDDKTALYTSILEKEDIDKIISRFDALILKLTQNINGMIEKKGNRYVEAILKIVDEKLGREVLLNEIADELQLNPAYVSRIFKEQMGVNFVDYLTEYRIGKSKEFLEHTNMKVKDIAEKLGYYNSNYFIKVFKQNTGLTPGAYRKMICN